MRKNKTIKSASPLPQIENGTSALNEIESVGSSVRLWEWHSRSVESRSVGIGTLTRQLYEDRYCCIHTE